MYRNHKKLLFVFFQLDMKLTCLVCVRMYHIETRNKPVLGTLLKVVPSSIKSSNTTIIQTDFIFITTLKNTTFKLKNKFNQEIHGNILHMSVEKVN